MRLTDAEGKNLVRTWPARPTELWELPFGVTSWFRALPKPKDSKITSPRLSPPRAEKLLTNPDGMWLNLAQRGLADVFCVDVCGSLANLNDKRARFVVVASSLVVRIERAWLLEEIRTKGRGMKARYQLIGAKKPSSAWHLPVRHLRVLFALSNDDYKVFGRNGVAAGHEYFCAHSSLGSFNSQRMQDFLRAMAPRRHFLTMP